MKVLIATPLFDAKVTIQYHQAALETIDLLRINKIGVSLIHEARNLIHQARNRSAHYALNNGFDKLLFIDADISWKPEDVLTLLKSDKKIVGGCYPLKAFPIKMNFVPTQGLYKTETFNINEYIESHADKETGEVEVHMLPTGFMMIDCSVFKEMEPHVQKYHHRDQLTRTAEHELMFFPFKIGDDGFLYTEDWGFCDEVRKLGYKIYWNTNVIVDHVGNHTYSALTPIDKSFKRIDIHEKNDQDQEPMVETKNPFKSWPRNLQCFCGSGKKFKKCCDLKIGDLVKDKMSKIAGLREDYQRMLSHVQKNAEQGIGYKLKEPVI